MSRIQRIKRRLAKLALKGMKAKTDIKRKKYAFEIGRLENELRRLESEDKQEG